MINGIKRKHYNKLVEVLQVQTNSTNEKLMILYLHKVLCDMGLKYGIDAAGNMLVIKGEAETYPCVVSHMDTVHDFVDNFRVVDTHFTYNNKTTKTFIRKDIELSATSDSGVVGVGGDDKCGIFACLYYLEVLPAVKVVFFSREEVGCRGSIGINHDFFSDCRYIIQLDRKGKGDFITNYMGHKTISQKLSSEVGVVKKKWGFKNATGSVTDSVKLWYHNVGISCMNISSGYYNPHMATEYVSVTDLFRAIWFVEDMINTLQATRYISKPPPPPKKYVQTTKYVSTTAQCTKCYKWTAKANLYTQNGKQVCFQCLNKDTIKPFDDDTKPILATECFICKTPFATCKSLRKVGQNFYCKNCIPICAVAGERATYNCHNCDTPVKIGGDARHRNGHFYCTACIKELALDYVGEDTEELQCSVCGLFLKKGEIPLFIDGKEVCLHCYDYNTVGNKAIRICTMCTLSLGELEDDQFINGGIVCNECWNKNEPREMVDNNKEK